MKYLPVAALILSSVLLGLQLALDDTVGAALFGVLTAANTMTVCVRLRDS